MSRVLGALTLLGLALFFGSCAEELQPRTQLTLRVTASNVVQATMAAQNGLKVRARRSRNGTWTTRFYDKAVLGSGPADIVLIPPDSANDVDSSFEVAVSAIDTTGRRLVEERALIVCRRHEQRGPYAMHLDPCGTMPLGAVCQQEDEDCNGAVCRSCVAGHCQPQPTYDVDAGLVSTEAVSENPFASAADMAARDDHVESADARSPADAAVAPLLADASNGGPTLRIDDVDSGKADATVPAPASPDATDGAAPKEVDAAASVAPDAGPPPCASAVDWVSATAKGTVSPNVLEQSRVVINGVEVPQYLCRYVEGDNQYPGKVNGTSLGTDYFDGCWYTKNNNGAWTGEPSSIDNQPFQALTTLKPACVHWTPWESNSGTLIPTGRVAGASVYSCRIAATETDSAGKHIGRWSGVPTEPCYVQYFAKVLSSTTFEVFALKP